jgi:hypothetical protein
MTFGLPSSKRRCCQEFSKSAAVSAKREPHQLEPHQAHIAYGEVPARSHPGAPSPVPGSRRTWT